MADFDVTRAVDGIVAFASSHYVLMLASIALLLLFSSKGVFARARSGIEKALIENWQLTLLASTGIALSLASAYTTWDGLRNFTRAPLLSLAISFGIQGVMLIVAWLIGESFAVGMNQRTAAGKREKLGNATGGMLLGTALAALIFYWLLNQYKAVSLTQHAGLQTDWVRFADVSVYFLMAVVLVALAVVGFRRGGDISFPYVQSVRVMVKNGVLWVMLLASMSASVFFSFDSHFNAIFPAEQRKRAAEIRTTSQIGSVIADVGALARTRQIEEAENLFSTPGWQTYDQQLSNLAQASQGAQEEIEAFFVQQMEERRRAINQQQERVASSQSGQAGLAVKKTSLTDELSRLKAERPGLAAEWGQHKSELDAKAKEIDAKRVEALAEDRGVEGTLKQGRGPAYKQRMGELATLQDQQAIKQERTKDARKRLTAVETRIAQIERELSGVDGDLAKLKGEAETALQRIKTTEASNTEEVGAKLDPARVLPAFERARAAFRQQPDSERLVALQQQCAALLGAMTSTQATKQRVRAIDCDPKQAAEAAGRVFALNAGVVAFQRDCAGGDKLAQHDTTDSLLAFGRKCLQDSGLIAKDSAAIGSRLSAIDMNRDDKAHRFVVTWNAFLDGNRLAYLSLVLAIGVDALVFMSGLFGANALRSPLSDMPSLKARSAHQLQSIIEASLLPNVFDKARMAREAMHPIEPIDGYTNIVRLGELDPETALHVRDVLNAGATIGAVRQTAQDGQYLVRAELYEFLCDVIKKELRARPAETKRGLEMNELETRMTEALLPHVGETADAVLHHLQPIDEKNGFTSEILMGDVEPQHLRPVRNVLTAGSSLGVVQRDRKDLDRYYLHANLYKTLARIRAKALVSTSRTALQLAARQDVRPLLEQRPRLEHHSSEGYADQHRRGAGRELPPPRLANAGNASPKSSHGLALSTPPGDDFDQSAGDLEIDPAVIGPFVRELGMPIAYLEDFLSESLAPAFITIAKAIDQQLSNIGAADVMILREAEELKQAKEKAIRIARDTVTSENDPRHSQDAEDLAEYFRQIACLLTLAEGGDYQRALKRLLAQASHMPSDVFPGGDREPWFAVVQDHHDRLAHMPRESLADWQKVVDLLREFAQQLEKLSSNPSHMHQARYPLN
jgi:hypothetical protein